MYEELKKIFEDDPQRPVTMRDLGEMKLLERVLKESLRLYPSVPFISRYLDEDTQLGECFTFQIQVRKGLKNQFSGIFNLLFITEVTSFNFWFVLQKNNVLGHISLALTNIT